MHRTSCASKLRRRTLPAQSHSTKQISRKSSKFSLHSIDQSALGTTRFSDSKCYPGCESAQPPSHATIQKETSSCSVFISDRFKKYFLDPGRNAQNTDFRFQVKMESKNVIANIKQSYKVETRESLEENVPELEVDQRAEFARKWYKYNLIMMNC